MKIAAILAAAAMMATPAMGQDAGLFEQYKAANLAFAANAEGAGQYLEAYQAQVMEGLEGRWFAIGTAMPRSDDAELFAGFCQKVGIDLEVRDDYTIAFTQSAGQDTAMTTIYTARGGNVFGRYTDATALLHRMGLDNSPADPSMIGNLLSDANGIATLHRPSPDILVVQTDYGVPQIYGRCAS